MFIEKRGVSNIYALILILIVALAIASLLVFSVNELSSSGQDAVLNNLASIVNGRSINAPETKAYLEANNYFTYINYDALVPNSRMDYVLSVGNRNDKIRGIEISGKRYVVDLIFCHWGTQTCAFKVNGVNTGGLHAFTLGLTDNTSSFNIDTNHRIMVNSITFDYCDNARFCNLHYEAYDIVNLTVMPR